MVMVFGLYYETAAAHFTFAHQLSGEAMPSPIKRAAIIDNISCN